VREHGWGDLDIKEKKVFKATQVNVATEETPSDRNYKNDDLKRYLEITQEP